MGIFSRFSDIVNSNINAILDKAEDPEKIVRLMIQEMEETLVEVRSAAARSIADKKELTRSLAALEREAQDWQSKAELAIDKGRDDLAKAALAEKARVQATAKSAQQQYDALSQGLEKLNEDIGRLEEKLADAKTRRNAILARHETATKRLEVRKRLYDYRIDDAFVRFEQFERRMDDYEARVEAYDLGAKQSLSQELADLESGESVEQELRRLKSKLAERKSDTTERS
jgi:phage shock protein A